MNRFGALLDRLAREPSPDHKRRLLTDYFRTEPDPNRGYALAAMTGALSVPRAKPALIRTLIAERTDPVLLRISHDHVGDLSETVALLWPAGAGAPPPGLGQIVETLHDAGKAEIPAHLARWLDALDEAGRWALLKLIGGSLRASVPVRLATAAVAALGHLSPDEIAQVWHAPRPPYTDLFAWVEGRAGRPPTDDRAPFRPPMLAYPIGPEDFAALNPEDFRAEWKWDGIRIQAVAVTAGEQRAARLWSRSGEDISAAFPEMVGLLRAAAGDFALDGQLLVVRDGLVQPASVARQRLNRRTVSPKSIADFPSHIRCYDLLMENGEDLRALGSDRRRARLEALIARLRIASIDLSPLVPFGTWDELAAARAKPDNAGAAAIEGVVLKRRDSPYIAGRVRGPWWTWKNDPIAIDAVLMYVRRGHGEHASFWSDCTFGVWRTVNGAEELVPVGEACLGFSDGDPIQLDRWVRDRTVNRFGPVREVAAGRDDGLVLEIAFEGLDRSTRRKSGIALRVPRVASIRWDKPPREADRLETLEALLRG